MFSPCYFHDKNGVIINLKVIPNSSKNEICGVILDADGEQLLKVKVTAVPDEGKANKALIKFLAEEFSVSKSNIEIISGKTARNKKILLHSSEIPNSLLEATLNNIEK
jgi:uncharacterized protein (TIGR00251 family)